MHTSNVLQFEDIAGESQEIHATFFRTTNHQRRATFDALIKAEFFDAFQNDNPATGKPAPRDRSGINDDTNRQGIYQTNDYGHGD